MSFCTERPRRAIVFVYGNCFGEFFNNAILGFFQDQTHFSALCAGKFWYRGMLF